MTLTKEDIGAITGAVKVSLMEELNPRFEKIDRQFEKVDQQFEKIDQKFEKIDQQFQKVDQQFEKIDRQFEKIDQRFEKVDQRFNEMDEKFTAGFKEMDRRFTMVGIKLNDVVKNLDFLNLGLSNVEKRLSRVEACLPFDNVHPLSRRNKSN